MGQFKPHYQTFKIGGSKDKLYPVWWQFGNRYCTDRITITRHFCDDHEEKPLSDKGVH